MDTSRSSQHMDVNRNDSATRCKTVHTATRGVGADAPSLLSQQETSTDAISTTGRLVAPRNAWGGHKPTTQRRIAAV